MDDSIEVGGLRLAAHIALPARPVFVLHGSDDNAVPLADAKALVNAAGSGAALCVVQAAGHELRHDPRAMAALLGWLDRIAP